MPDPAGSLNHLLVIGHAEDRDFKRAGHGSQKVREADRASHGQRILDEAAEALSSRPDNLAGLYPELLALGTVITIEGALGFDLKLESLEQHSNHKVGPRPKWLLLSVQPADGDRPELAQVWVSDEYRAKFTAPSSLSYSNVTSTKRTQARASRRTLPWSPTSLGSDRLFYAICGSLPASPQLPAERGGKYG
ncbi:MAG: hypothetical protein OXD37_01620 [Acidimicrobiaceae bacterium]|nr:hypothetical protein [Acidimicrobiaceae bacterium]